MDFERLARTVRLQGKALRKLIEANRALIDAIRELKLEVENHDHKG